MHSPFRDAELGKLFTELQTLNMPVEYENTGGGCEAISWQLPESKQEVLITNLDQPSGRFVLGIYDTETGEATDYFGEYAKAELVNVLSIFANMRANA
jgi:hypothetical protein